MNDKGISRRKFVKNSALGLALGTHLSSSLMAENDNKPVLKWGVIGTGHRARHHIRTLNQLPCMNIVATCDTDEDNLKLGVQRVGKPVRTYKDYRDLLNDPQVEAVLVCTPNIFHKEMVIAALKADKYVMSEKPMAVSYDECLEMEKAEKAASKFVLYSLQLRYSYKFGDLKKVIDSGKIGKPQYIFLPEYRGDWYTTNPWMYTDPKTGKKINWRYSHAASGGTLSEKMCHYFDIINWILGSPPEKILCNGGINHYNDDRDTWDHASVHLEYPNNTKALISLCMYAPPRLDPQIIGELGSLHLTEDHILFEGTGSQKGKTEKIPLTKEVGHGVKGPKNGLETAVVRMYQDFYNCVQSKTRPSIGIKQAMIASKIAWLGELSAKTNAQVTWNQM